MADYSRLPPPLSANWDWQLNAACRGMDSAAFFSPVEERPVARQRRIAAAKQICNVCPVLTNCRSHALSTREAYGIWGGLSEDERAEILGLRSLRYPARNPDSQIGSISDPSTFTGLRALPTMTPSARSDVAALRQTNSRTAKESITREMHG